MEFNYNFLPIFLCVAVRSEKLEDIQHPDMKVSARTSLRWDLENVSITFSPH